MYLINELEAYLWSEVREVKCKGENNERHITLLEVLLEIKKLKEKKMVTIQETRMD